MGYTRPSFNWKDTQISVGDTIYVVDPERLVIHTGEIIVIRTRQFWAKVKGVAVKDFSKDFNMTSKYVTKAVFNTPHRKAYSCALTMEDAATELASLLVQRGKRYGVKLKSDRKHE